MRSPSAQNLRCPLDCLDYPNALSPWLPSTDLTRPSPTLRRGNQFRSPGTLFLSRQRLNISPESTNRLAPSTLPRKMSCPLRATVSVTTGGVTISRPDNAPSLLLPSREKFPRQSVRHSLSLVRSSDVSLEQLQAGAGECTARSCSSCRRPRASPQTRHRRSHTTPHKPG